jgi:hypothetical protein
VAFFGPRANAEFLPKLHVLPQGNAALQAEKFKISAQTAPSQCYQSFVIIQSSKYKIQPNAPIIFSLQRLKTTYSTCFTVATISGNLRIFRRLDYHKQSVSISLYDLNIQSPLYRKQNTTGSVRTT